MRYSIGQFAEILGVTPDTLRLYEKYDIIRPIKDDKNNYRYFNDLDCRDLLLSRWYRSMQIPLHDVSALTKNSSLENVIEIMSNKQLNLEEEIREKTRLLNKIAEIKDEICGIKPALNKCIKKKLPGIYRLKQTYKDLLLKDEMMISMANKWMNLLPFTFQSFEIFYNEIFSEENCFGYDWGLAIYEDEAHDFNIEKNENIEYISPSTYISSIIMSPHREGIKKNTLQFMLNFIEENQFSIAGNIIGKILLTEKIDGESISYLEVNIPIAL